MALELVDLITQSAVELMLHELADERLVDAVGSGWRRR